MKILTVKEMASIGGKARAKKLSKKRRKEIAMKAGLANKARIEALKLSTGQTSKVLASKI
jgi:hypothetical protein